MKKMISAITAITLMLLFAACSASFSESNSISADASHLSLPENITKPENTSILEQTGESENDSPKEDNKMNITIGDKTFTATLADNSSAAALKELLSNSPMTIDMRGYGNFEKVGSIGTELPRNDEQMTTSAGDIILYQGNSLVIYYDENLWNFTRIGRIDNVTQSELKEALGEGNVTVTFSLESDSVSKASELLTMDNFKMPNGKTVYYYVPQAVKNAPDNKVPLMLFMCGTTCDPVDNCVDSGWLKQAEKEKFIVISPDYNNYATYSETDFLISTVEYMLENYPVDRTRIYSTGFSNGGAASVALTRDYPQYFAAISAMGWMVDLDNKDGVFGKYDMPFQVVQGDGEFTEKTSTGAMRVMNDEVNAIRSLMLYNEMISEDIEVDYDKTPYWGYAPDETRIVSLCDLEWNVCEYYKDGFTSPFAELITVNDSKHQPRDGEAEIAWEFFKHFSRDENGEIVCSVV